jgi:hypothetical protein
MENNNQTAVDAFDGFFGTPGENTGDAKRVTIYPRKLKQSETIVARVLPPIKSQKNTGRWFMRHGVHYGFVTENKKDKAGKPWPKPFICKEVRDFNTKMVTTECPLCTKIEEQKNILAKLERDILSGLSEKATKKEIAEKLKANPAYVEVSTWLKTFNIERKYYINVKYLDGTVGTLAITTNCFKSLKEKIEKLKAQKIDALSPKEGRYFAFSRNDGDFNETKYEVTVYTESMEVDGEVVQKTKKAPLVQEDLAKISASCLDLPTAHSSADLTEEQVRTLVESNEDQDVVDLVFSSAQYRPQTVAVEESPVVAGAASLPVAPPSAKTKAREEVEGLAALRAATGRKPVAPKAAKEDQILEELMSENE